MPFCIQELRFYVKRNSLEPESACSMIASLLHLRAFHNKTSIINHSHGNVLESLVEVCSLEVLMLTHLPPNHTSRLHFPQLTWACTVHGRMLLCVKYNRAQLPQIGQASDFHVMYCRRRRSKAAGRKRGTPKKAYWNEPKPPYSLCMACLKVSALPLSSPPAHSMSPDRQKMLSFTPCVTSQANSIKIPSKEEC